MKKWPRTEQHEAVRDRAADPNEKLTSGYYRVRKTWKDSKSQVGAYRILKNAKAAADKNPGTYVFTNDGVAIYPAEDTTEEICFDIHMVVEGCAPKFTAPKKAVQTPDFRKICMNCPNHRDD